MIMAVTIFLAVLMVVATLLSDLIYKASTRVSSLIEEDGGNA